MNSTCGCYHVTVLIAKSSEFESSRKGEIARNLKMCCQQNAEEEKQKREISLLLQKNANLAIQNEKECFQSQGRLTK